MAKGGTNKRNGNGANLGFEQTLWAAADKLRGHLDAAEYKHVRHQRPGQWGPLSHLLAAIHL